jgi:hypothetical protein
MRSTGLTAADWAVITEYQDCLQPLKFATELLEGRGKSGNFGPIYEVIPVFEYVLSALEARTRPYERVDFNYTDAITAGPTSQSSLTRLALGFSDSGKRTNLSASALWQLVRLQ